MELNLVCDDVIIVLHCGLWSCLKCAYEADSPPRSKSRGRGSVHINFPRPLHEVEHTSKWQRGFPRGEVLREVHEWVSKSGVERSLNEWVTDSLGLSLWMSHWIIGSLGLSLWMSHWIIGSLGLSLWMSHWITDSLGLSLWMSHWITDSLGLSLSMSHWITRFVFMNESLNHWLTRFVQNSGFTQKPITFNSSAVALTETTSICKIDQNRQYWQYYNNINFLFIELLHKINIICDPGAQKQS